MISEHTVPRRVEFSDTDMAGIVHFAKFFHYMEAAEHDLFRRMGLSVAQKPGENPFCWPRVHVECDYLSPLYFEDEIDVRLIVREMRTKAIVFGFEFTRKSDRKVVARGSMTTVCTQRDADGRMYAVPIDPVIREQLAVAPRSDTASS
ncbi:MAG: acyl-CoA thioesterase [Planctomycetes bacterium]|nr:acyl-CoA thioesterase [Planctomycetota bacterium]